MIGKPDAIDLKLIENFLEQERLAIIASQQTKGLKAHGSSAAALRTEQTSEGGQLIDGTGTFEFQEFGRNPGRMPPWNAIYQWLELKKYGLVWDNDTQRRALAWRIAMKIKRKGSYTHIRKKPTGVLTDTLSQENLDPLLEALAEKYQTQVLSDVQRAITKIK